MKLAISKNIERVVNSITTDLALRREFLQAIEKGDHGISAVAWLRGEPKTGLYEKTDKRPTWIPEWIDVAADDARPGKTAEHEAGEIYLLDLSSTFAIAALSVVNLGESGVVLDMCAAPGGKGILAWRYLRPELTIANEVIRKRTAQLISNYQRCSIDPAIVCSCDPGLLATLVPGRANLVIVDAPCSGQSLLLKGLAAPGAFHFATVALNERRQRRILANSAITTAPGGFILYSTCTFSREENEKNIECFCKTFPNFSPVEIPILSPYRSDLSELPSYRLAPYHGFGAGAFVALLRNNEAGSDSERLTADNVNELIWPLWRSGAVGRSTTFR